MINQIKMKKLPFILLIILTITLAGATFAENRFGTPFVLSHIYGSWWMITLWAAIFLAGFYLCISKLIKNRKPALLLHLSFGVILLGALLTFTTSKSGQIHLRENGESKTSIELPFELKLNDFSVDHYKGTDTPSDYISRLTFVDGNKTFDATVSMNNILKYRGFRFYQASYDKDLQGSILSVSYDPFGITVTYTGYLMLLLSMIWILTSKRGRFRNLIRSLGIILLFIIPLSSSAQRTLNKDEAKSFGKLSMFYNGRIAPVNTYAQDFTKKITGKSTYKDFDAVQVLSGWIFFPQEWENEKLIKIKSKEVRRLVSEGADYNGRLRFGDFFQSGIYKLSAMGQRNQNKGIIEADEKIGLLFAQDNGNFMTIFPQGNKWYSPNDDLTNVNPDDTLFISKIFLLMRETLENKDSKSFIELVEKISLYQQKKAAQGAISPTKTEVEIFYNSFDVTGILFKINLVLGFLAFGIFLWELLSNKKIKGINILFTIQLIASLVLLTLKISLRWYISGHIPLSNGYETMIFVAWFVLLISLLSSRKIKILKAAGLLLSGFILLVASLGAMNPQITKLVPVLMSPWLSIHVSLLMISYSLLGLITFNGITAIILHSISQNHKDFIAKLKIISQILLYPALFTLTVGIFTGAVWANVSWGRYWGWDPKEVWALITMLVYSLAMHSESLPIFRKTIFYHIFMVIAFCTVLMTYFGVNLFFGGMHSY
jgi:cytochrome c-type biogenesis protein CcsB